MEKPVKARRQLLLVSAISCTIVRRVCIAAWRRDSALHGLLSGWGEGGLTPY